VEISVSLFSVGLLVLTACGVANDTLAEDFRAVPELGYRVSPDFFHSTEPFIRGEASGIALNSKEHIFLFQRVRPMLTEYDATGNFVRSIGDGLFTHPHGLRIDHDDNIWTTELTRNLRDAH
jgi:hypothetical protein